MLEAGTVTPRENGSDLPLKVGFLWREERRVCLAASVGLQEVVAHWQSEVCSVVVVGGGGGVCVCAVSYTHLTLPTRMVV